MIFFSEISNNLFSKTYFSGENLLLESNSPLVLELLRIFRASLTFLGTEVGGWGGADVGKLAGPEKKRGKLNKNLRFESFGDWFGQFAATKFFGLSKVEWQEL